MSSESLDPELSSGELRSKLFHSFKSKGVVQSVKTQLRKQLALDLHEKAISRDSTKRKDLCDDGVLFQRICNSLFVDHLKRCLYDYTLSVFISESSTNLDHTIPLPDILELLQVKQNSKLYDVLSNACTYSSNVKSFLWTFLAAIAKEHRNPVTTMECSVQTDEVHTSLDRKLLEIEKSQLEKLQRSIKGDYQSVQEKLLAFQRQYEVRKQEELKNEVARFRSSELANMRIEEREKCQKEFARMKTEYEMMYNSKLKHLERQETEMHAKASRQEKEFEKEGYEQRQKIMEEMEALKQRGMELKREQKSALSCIEAEERKVKSKEEELKLKEKSIIEMEEYYGNKLKHETLRMKVEVQEQDLEKAKAVDIREQELKDEIIHFQSQKLVYLQWKDEADRLVKDNEQLSAFIEKSRQSYETLNQKYKNVCERYEKVTDYKDIKNKNMLLQKDLEVCKKSLADFSLQRIQETEEHQKSVKDLLAKINQASFENENEFRLLQEKERSVTTKYQVLQSKHDILQKKHTLQLRKNEELRKLYEEILLSQRELLRECDELKLQLQFGIQEREKVVQLQGGKTKLLLSNITHNAMQDEQMSMPRNNKKKVKLLEFSNEHIATRTDIEESNNVLQRLEQEAVELEKSYKQFQEKQQHIKSQLPQYIEKTKVAIETTTMEMQRNYDNYREDLVNASQTLQTVQSDSFNISHLIPSRWMPESNTRRSAPKYSTPVTSCENSAQTLTSSFRVTELNQLSSTDPFAKKQVNMAQARTELRTNDSLEQNDVKRSNQVPLTETIQSMRSLTQIPLTETIQPLKSLTQMPLTETILPMTSLNQMVAVTETTQSANSLTQILLTETTQPMNSLTQIPLTETICRIEGNKSNFGTIPSQSNEDQMKRGKNEAVEKETMQPPKSRTQMTSTETIHPMTSLSQMVAVTETTQSANSLTQILLTETVQPMNSLTQIPLTETICRIEDQTKVRHKDEAVENVNLRRRTSDKFNIKGSETPSASALRKIVSHIETFEPPINSSSNLHNEDFVSTIDPFKTTNFMLKGFQSTGLVGDDEHGQSVEALHENSAGSKESDIQEYLMQDDGKASEGDSIPSLPEKSENLNIRKTDASADSLGIACDLSDSELSTNNKVKVEHSNCKNISEGEFDHGNIKSIGETSIEDIKSAGEAVNVDENSEVPEETDNPMNQYMQMILEKRKTDSEHIDDDHSNQVEKKNSVHDDISLSHSEGQNEISEPLSSDFEW